MISYKDYYAILGVSKTATPGEIKSAYRKLARQYHPDVNKASDAETKFKELGEAYEVLFDPVKREKYDTLGPDWAQQFADAPQGKRRSRRRTSPEGSTSYEFRTGGGDFSEFFQAFFGGMGGSPFGEPMDSFGETTGRTSRMPDLEATLELDLTTALRGGPQSLQIGERQYNVTIPAGIRPGSRLRLTGQGQANSNGPSGDLYLRVEVKATPPYRMEGSDVVVPLPISPAQAALGGEVPVALPESSGQIRIPASASSGTRLRLAGRGLSKAEGGRGDLYIEVRIVFPKSLSARQRELYEQLRKLD